MIGSDESAMMDNNVAYSQVLLDFALARGIPFVYASSASVYGVNHDTAEVPANEAPLNLYARSKLAFDQHVRRWLSHARSTVVGLRYFNVYGARETQKGNMASMVYQLYRQIAESGTARLFEGTDGYDDGEQQRDFVAVDDVAEINLHFALSDSVQGIFNVGTGRARSFNDIARTLIKLMGRGRIKYIPFPESLQGRYQSFTEANLDGLRRAGYDKPFLTLEEGIARAHKVWQSDEVPLPD